MARAALRDDLFALHAELTADVLRCGGIDAWLETNRQAAERAQEILAEIRSGGTFDLTTLPVAMREVRNLITRG
jgi:glutamate dehydrogenase